MPPNTRQPTTEDLRTKYSLIIADILSEVQVTLANHTKNHATLHKAHMNAVEYTEESPKGLKLVGERIFRDVLLSFILRAFAIKKGVHAADRVLKFIGGYIKYMNEKVLEKKLEQGSDVEDDDDDDNDATTAARFTEYLLKTLQRGFLAKDKNVRYRVLYTLSQMITHLGQIKEETFKNLRQSLIDRMQDKEANIRTVAAICLAKLTASEDPAEVEAEVSALEVLLDAMTYDFSPEVRRVTLMNIPLNSRSLPVVLARMRDTDQNTRKLLYGSILAQNIVVGSDTSEEEIPGPTHPQILTIAQRELIVKHGLGDRDNTVKSAAALLISKWMSILSVKTEDTAVKIEDIARNQAIDKPLCLLSIFDLNSGNNAAFDALQSVFQTDPEIFKNITFIDDEYWRHLTPEKAFLARVFVDYCKSSKAEDIMESALPEVTSIAFRIQDAYNQLAEFQQHFDDFLASRSEDESEAIRMEEDKTSREFVLSELLRLAVNLDYSDEIGRRKTFQLVRTMLGAEFLPEILMGPCLDILRELSSSERDLIRIVVETVQELRDTVIGDKEAGSPHSQQQLEDVVDDAEDSLPVVKPAQEITPEEQMRLDYVDSKCLALCIGMLERVNSTFEENMTLDGVLSTLIIPSAQKKDGTLREKGTKALGLCCLIARRLAVKCFKIFMNQITSSPSSIRLLLARALIDIFMVHKDVIFRDQTNNLEMITLFLLLQIRNDDDPEVQAILSQGTAKLVIAGLITDIEAVKTLLKIYVSPQTVGNDVLRQSLSIFFDMYSLNSSLENQQRMREIFIHIFLDISEDRRQALEADGDANVVESAQIASMFLEWTQPHQLPNDALANEATQIDKQCIQLDMAKDIITVLFEKDVTLEKEDKRVLCQLLNKLYIPDRADVYRIRSLKLLMNNLRTRRPIRDYISRTAFTKFEASITKKFEKQLEGFSEEEFRELEELEDLFMFLDSIIPLDDTDSDINEPRRGRKRRSRSIASVITDSRSVSPAARNQNRTARSKRPRLSNMDDDDDDDASTQRGTPVPSAPTRTIPQRAAASRKPPSVIFISSDSEENEESPSNRSRKQTSARYRPSIKKEFEEAELGEECEPDSILDDDNTYSMNEVPYDSIMGSDSEEEEEVNGLLAEE